MMARALTCPCISNPEGLTTSELAQRLQVSPASISQAIAFLESQAPDRRELAPDVLRLLAPALGHERGYT